MLRKRPQITVSVPFVVYPPISGGQQRAFYLYKELAKWFDVELITLNHPNRKLQIKQITEGLKEIQVPKAVEHLEQENSLSSKLGIQASLVGLPLFYKHTTEYLYQLEKSCNQSEAVITCHPYGYSMIKEVTDIPIWYEAQDFEYSLYNRLIPDGPKKEALLSQVKEVERECCNVSSLIMTCSKDDGIAMAQLYKFSEEKLLVVPNGVDLETIPYHNVQQREGLRSSSNRPITCIFIGSGHPPNIVAVEHIIKAAKSTPNVNYVIAGSCGSSFLQQNIKAPKNVNILGMISDEEKDIWLNSSDVALNPMAYGSGTNLKMLEYFAAGLPVITTETGARGLELIHNHHVWVAHIDHFTDAIVLLSGYVKLREKLSDNALSYVRECFNWEDIGDRLVDSLRIKGLLAIPTEKRMGEIIEPLKYRSEVFQNRMVELSHKRDIYIWGAGSSGMNTRSILKKLGIDIQGFVDGDVKKAGTFMNEAIIISPSELSNLGNKPFIIISSIYSNEIKPLLCDLGYAEETDFVEQDVNVPSLFFHNSH